MRRFDDILRILSSIILGMMVRDFDDVNRKLCKFVYPNGESDPQHFIATASTIAMIVLLFRNIHGSARYDDAVGRTGFVPSFEKCLVGRIFSFFLAVAGLFGGPGLTWYLLRHLPADASNVTVGGLMLGTLLIYTIWDTLLLFFTSDDDKDQGNIRMGGVILTWVKISYIGIVILVGLWLYDLYMSSKREVVPPSVALSAFMCVAVFVVFADYYFNRAFYFPAAERIQAEKRLRELHQLDANELRAVFIETQAVGGDISDITTRIYNAALTLLSANPDSDVAKELAVDLGRWHLGRCRPDGKPTKEDERVIQKAVLLRSLR